MYKKTSTGVSRGNNPFLNLSEKENIIRDIALNNIENLKKNINIININEVINSKNGYTPLYCAIQQNNKDIIDFLLKFGASTSIKTIDGLDAFGVSLKHHDRNIIDSINEKNIYEIVALKDKVTILTEDISFSKNENNYLKKSLDTANSKNNSFKIIMTENDEYINSLKKDKDNLYLKLKDTNEENDSLKRKYTVLHKDNELNINKINSFALEKESLEKRNNFFDKENKDLLSQFNDINSKFNKIYRENDSLHIENTNLKNENTKLIKRNSDISISFENLRKRSRNE